MKALLEGWKTRLLSLCVAVLGIVEALDPSLITTAFGLGSRGNAILLITIAVAIFVLRQLTNSPAPPLVKKK
jgi:hypothetical protein